MPQFPWQKSFNRSSRPSHSSSFYVEGPQQHPDLPLSPGTRSHIQRSTSVTERHGHQLDYRRSIALFPNPNSSTAYYPDNPVDSAPTTNTDSFYTPSRSPVPGAGIVRSQTVVYRDTSHRVEPIYEVAAAPAPSPLWTPDLQSLPTPNEEHEIYFEEAREELPPMNSSNAPGKTSSDSGSATGLDRWSQRRLQRLNTEQGFREQRQGGNSGGAVLSPTPGGDHSFPPQQQQQQQQISNNYTTQHEAAQPQSIHQQSQPQQSSYPPSTRSSSNAGLGHQSSSNNNTTHSRSPNNYSHDPSPQHQQQQQQQYSPPDALSQYHSQQANSNNRAILQQTRSYQSGTTANAAAPSEADSMALSNSNGNVATTKAARSGIINRQSVHTDLLTREPPSQNADPRRPTPQPLPASEEMTEEDVTQLIKDHKELREKYTKVKKYYFEKEDQVKQLQNSLAHQRLSQSRTSLDDSEYTTRFNRLDGLIAQLAFSIRKSWRSLPSWLANSVNKDAVTTGKQEMTAAGRAFISCWLVEEVFDKYFHPDLEPALSAQLKSVQRNIRRFATPAQTAEEEDHLISKVVNWRLATLEGLADALRSPQCPTFRAQMTDMLKEHLCGALAVHLQEPPPSDLEGGVHMIVELVVSIAIHLPLESRDVVIEYFMPSHNVTPDQMKLESGIPALTVSIADDAAERASLKSATSDPDGDSIQEQPSKKRGMLSALTGSSNKLTRNTNSQQKSSAGASSSSLQRPESSAGKDEPPKVRMAAGIGVSIRGRSVLVKAPVFST